MLPVPSAPQRPAQRGLGCAPANDSATSHRRAGRASGSAPPLDAVIIYRVSHPVAAEDPVSPHSARLSGNRPFTDTRSGRGRIRRVWRREQSERPPRRAGRCPCRSAHGRPRQLYLPSGLTIGAAHGRRPWSGSYASRNCGQGHTGHQPSPSSARLIIAYLGGEARERWASSKGDESHAQYQGPIALWPRAPGCSGQEHPMSTTAYAARSGPDSLPHDTGRDCDRCGAQAVFTVRTRPATSSYAATTPASTGPSSWPPATRPARSTAPRHRPRHATRRARPPGRQPAVPQRLPQGLI